MIVCVAANPSIDKLFEVERLVPGSIHRPLSFVEVAGGKGLNAARAAACVGAVVRAIALVGGHAGAWIEDALAREGVDARFAHGVHETRSCLSVADARSGTLTEFYEDGPAVEPETWSDLVTLVEESLDGASWLTISGSVPPGAPEDGYADLVSAARTADVRVAVDARGPFLRHALTSGPDLVKVNSSEATEVVGERGSPVAVATELRRVAGGDRHAVVVTLGAEGAVAIDEEGTTLRATLEARGRYPVGSGDAFLGGLVAELDGGGTLRVALASALGAGAANAELPGAGRLERERARALAARARVEMI